MAIVYDKGRDATPVDKPLTSPNRVNAGTPISVLTPLYAGEIILDSTSGILYYAFGLTSSSWTQANIGT
jgi:hypothetical protein